jgi:hypothetical protein
MVGQGPFLIAALQAIVRSIAEVPQPGRCAGPDGLMGEVLRD